VSTPEAASGDLAEQAADAAAVPQRPQLPEVPLEADPADAVEQSAEVGTADDEDEHR